ncbi:retrotransposable element ORF2 protein [Plecturocebus cupreus]
MEYYAAIKDDELVSFVGTWMNLETIILSKLTQEQKIKHCMFSLIVEMEFHHVCQAGLELLTSTEQPALASQSAGITSMKLRDKPQLAFDVVSEEQDTASSLPPHKRFSLIMGHAI